MWISYTKRSRLIKEKMEINILRNLTQYYHNPLNHL